MNDIDAMSRADLDAERVKFVSSMQEPIGFVHEEDLEEFKKDGNAFGTIRKISAYGYNIPVYRKI